MFEQIGIPIEGLGDGFSWKSQDLEHSAQLARDGWQRARAAILSGEFFLVVLDEITYPLIYGWLPLDDVLATLRAHGRGKAVKIFQFMKVPTARFGEHRMFEQIGLPIEGLGDGFSWKSKDLEHSAQLARDGWEKARAAILSGEHFLVVLDEITYPLIYGWLPLDGVLQTLRERPKDVHVCLTGRRCPPEIIELADTVTEMQMVKHAFKAGIPAQRGIED